MTHWTKGRLSGYPWCCRLYFYVRLFVLNVFGSKFLALFKNLHNKKIGYVQCILHNVLYRLNLYTVNKYRCPECGWDQIKGNSCMIKNLHSTWVIDEITTSYKRQIKNNGRIWFRQPGPIAHKIEQELTKK